MHVYVYTVRVSIHDSAAPFQCSSAKNWKQLSNFRGNDEEDRSFRYTCAGRSRKEREKTKWIVRTFRVNRVFVTVCRCGRKDKEEDEESGMKANEYTWTRRKWRRSRRGKMEKRETEDLSLMVQRTRNSPNSPSFSSHRLYLLLSWLPLS